MNAREEVGPGSAPSFSARADIRNGIVNIALTGELDMATVSVLDDQLVTAESGRATAIVLDLRELTFLDCSGLHAFIAARDRATAARCQLILIGASHQTRRLFDLTGTGYLLDDTDAANLLGRFAGTDDTPGGTDTARDGDTDG